VAKDWGPKPFRSIDVWLLDGDFKNLVKEKWNSYNVQGDDTRRFKEKLKLLKADLKIWNKEVFGHLETTKSRILKDIEDLDNKDDDNMLEDMDRLERLDLMRQLRVIDSKLELVSPKG